MEEEKEKADASSADAGAENPVVTATPAQPTEMTAHQPSHVEQGLREFYAALGLAIEAYSHVIAGKDHFLAAMKKEQQ
jgi:uncharacterized protein YpbB